MMMKIKNIFSALVFAVMLLPSNHALANEQPRKALGIDDPGGNVMPYAARLRLTRSTWNYLKLTLRDTFKKWDYKGGDGFNLLLDPGYDEITHSAGPIRTTPYTQRWGGFYAVSRPSNDYNCGTWGNCDHNTGSCGSFCQNGSFTDCNAGGFNLRDRSGWTQCRKPGFQSDDMPLVDGACTSAFQEFGFYIPAPGGDTAGGGPCGGAAASADFQQFQVCTSDYRYDNGMGKPDGTPCTGSAVLGGLDYNARIFLYPNMRQENIAPDPVDGWDSTVGGTKRRGPYTGYGALDRWKSYTSANNCQTQNAGCQNGGQCCNIWCLGCGSWAPCGTTTSRVGSCPAAATLASYTWYNRTNTTPQNTGYNPDSAYSETQGTYFRTGDDTAVYTNIMQMQIQSWDRASYQNPTCGEARIYKGPDAGGLPSYFTDDNPVRNCMRPKMYWDTSWPASDGGPKWRQCDPFDTWNTDGTLNPKNDDAKWIYPNGPDGPNTYGLGEYRCGRQACTVGTCTSANNAWSWDTGSWTSNLNDIYSDNDGINPGRGTGWYGLKLLGDPVLDAGTNRIDVAFTGKDVRIEMGAALDFKAIWPLEDPQPVAFVTGRVLLDALTIKVSLYLFSIDDASCTNAYPAACSGNWRSVNDGNLMNTVGGINPDKLIIDAVITDITLDPASSWIEGNSSCLIDILGCWINVQELLNIGFVRDMIVPELKTAIQDALGGALTGITSAVPNLNGVLGNPINLGTALVDSGIFLAGEAGAPAAQTLVDGNTKKWPVWVSQGPGAPSTAQNLVDMRMAIGFKPIAFIPTLGANGVMDIDQSDPPLPSSVYGVPELWKAATNGPNGPCPQSGAGAVAPYKDYCAPDGVTVLKGSGCSTPAHYAMKDTDQVHDTDDYCRGKVGSTTDAWYYHPKTNAKVNLAYAQAVPDFWKGPITKFNKPPAWCMVVGANNMPNTLRTGATPANLKTLYPAYPDVGAAWLSFDSTLDKGPAGTGTRNTIGTWDSMPSGSVLTQGNTNNGVQNNGNLDAAVIPYDFSMHIHQRTFVEFAQAAFAAGVGCLEFGAQDTTGADSPWKSLFAVDRFAAFLPEVRTLFPNGYVKMRIMPLQLPRIRVGMGNLNFTPASRIKDSINGALPVSNQPYTLSMALPDLQIQFLVDSDPNDLGNPAKEVKLLTMKWNTVLGFYAKAVRQCYFLDPFLTSGVIDEFGVPELDRCTSPYTNVRTVSGYYELFFDLNGQSLNAQGNKTGSNMLGKAWEAPANTRDGFSAGRFSNESFACPGCVAPNVAVPSGQAMFEITQSYCSDKPSKCDLLGLSQSIPALLSSTIQMFLVTRLNFYNLTIDFLYIGPDGPNNDGLGTAGVAPFNRTNGDYLAIYARFLGSLNVFGLLDSVALLAPKEGGFQSQAIIKDISDGQFMRTGSPEFPIQLQKSQMAGDLESVISYTYSVDDGFWHTPVDYASLQLSGLTEGEHKLTLRTFEDTKIGATTNLTPTVLRFAVDTLPPQVEILPSDEGYFSKAVRVKTTDIQTPVEKLKNEFSWDDSKDWQETDGPSISVRKLKPGRHVLRVQSTDLAGNIGTAAREVVVDAKGWGCSSAGNSDASPVLILLALLAIGFRGRRRA